LWATKVVSRTPFLLLEFSGLTTFDPGAYKEGHDGDAIDPEQTRKDIAKKRIVYFILDLALDPERESFSQKSIVMTTKKQMTKSVADQ